VGLSMDVEVIELCKTFGKTEVLWNFNGNFKEKSITCIMGSSGCGKTTLLNILMGLIKADSGRIKGIEDKKISSVFQEDRLCEKFSSVDNIKLVCNKEIDINIIRENLKLVGIEDGINKPVSELSGGMKRRVAIVRAILSNADLIIMDEPFKGLDYGTKKIVIEYVMNNTKGKTLIIATHYIDEVELLKATLIKM
jgi:NitT/TauT family transport system ATP-binding protein